MAVLDTKIQNKIDELRLGANQYFKTDKETYFLMKKEAWGLYPIPKNQWNEAYALAKDFFSVFIREGELEKSQKWLDRMIDNNNNLHLFDIDIDFNIGKYHFENKDYDKALEKWKYVVSEAGFRYFEREKPEYLEFYNNPEKYLN